MFHVLNCSVCYGKLFHMPCLAHVLQAVGPWIKPYSMSQHKKEVYTWLGAADPHSDSLLMPNNVYDSHKMSQHIILHRCV